MYLKRVVFCFIAMSFTFCKGQEKYYIINDTIYTKKQVRKITRKKFKQNSPDSIYKFSGFQIRTARLSKDSIIYTGNWSRYHDPENKGWFSGEVGNEFYDFIGKKLPEFRTITTDSKFVTNKDFLKKPHLIYFWFPKDPLANHLRNVTISLNEFYQDYEKSVGFYTINNEYQYELIENDIVQNVHFDHLVNCYTEFKDFLPYRLGQFVLVDDNGIIIYIAEDRLGKNSKTFEKTLFELRKKLDNLLFN